MSDSNFSGGPNPCDDDLRSALRELAAADAPALLQRARSRARARVERLLEEALVDDLLAAAAVAADRSRTPAAEPEAVETGKPEMAPGQVPAPGEPTAGEAWWTYCILRVEDAVAAASGLEGVDPGTGVEAICDGDLAALASPVPLTEYGDERLREHLEDLEWVERTARRHENVLEATLRETSIVPLRLCTLYRERDGVLRLLDEHREALLDGLRRVEGCLEWGVKVFADPRPPTTSEKPDAEGRGASYLIRRQEERAMAERAAEVRARCVEVVHQRIGALARDATANPPQLPEAHGRDLAMLLNGAYLIERGRVAPLQDAVATLQEEWATLGFTIELTGPWPPYNFVAGAAGVMS